MYQALLAIFGLPVGLVVGAFTGALLGSTLDNPNAGHMTRGAGALAGMFLVAPLGAAGGIVCGYWLGGRMDRRGERRALQIGGAASSAEGLRNHRRMQSRAQTRVLMCAACGAALGFAVEPRAGPGSILVLGGSLLGALVGWAGHLFLSSRSQRRTPTASPGDTQGPDAEPRAAPDPPAKPGGQVS